jgi:hypothetical protein
VSFLLRVRSTRHHKSGSRHTPRTRRQDDQQTNRPCESLVLPTPLAAVLAPLRVQVTGLEFVGGGPPRLLGYSRGLGNNRDGRLAGGRDRLGDPRGNSLVRFRIRLTSRVRDRWTTLFPGHPLYRVTTDPAGVHCRHQRFEGRTDHGNSPRTQQDKNRTQVTASPHRTRGCGRAIRRQPAGRSRLRSGLRHPGR